MNKGNNSYFQVIAHKYQRVNDIGSSGSIPGARAAALVTYTFLQRGLRNKESIDLE